jgi:chemotaxis protein CheX
MQATSISDQQVAEVVQTVFDTMLNLPTVHAPGQPPSVRSFEVAGMIHITGGWNGTVLLLCNEAIATRAASIMLDVPQENATLADNHDAIAELTNIIGGGVKSVLPGPSALSLPTVTQGSDFHLHVHWTEQVAQADLTCDGEALQVRVLEGTGDLKLVSTSPVDSN